MDRGLKRAQNEFNAALCEARLKAHADVATSPQPPYFEYGIIVSAMRLFLPGMSRYVQRTDFRFPPSISACIPHCRRVLCGRDPPLPKYRPIDPICCRYYDALFQMHPHANADDITSMASVNLIKVRVASKMAGAASVQLDGVHLNG